jgi:hypothetical protein
MKWEDLNEDEEDSKEDEEDLDEDEEDSDEDEEEQDEQIFEQNWNQKFVQDKKFCSKEVKGHTALTFAKNIKPINVLNKFFLRKMLLTWW